MTLYLYALVPSDADADFGKGLGGESLERVSLGSMAAVVGHMERQPPVRPEVLRCHDEVVRRIGRLADAVLPFRFGAILPSPRELIDTLTPRFQALATSLERARGCEQMSLRYYSEERAAPGPATNTGPGTRWLRERSTHGLGHRFALLRDAVRSLVRAEIVEGHETAPLRASLFHLVERARLAEYRDCVERLEPLLAPAWVSATGPWPPYAFAGPE